MENSTHSEQKQKILNAPMGRVIFELSWPAVLAMVLYGLNSVFDAFFVGRFVGETALAGVSLAYPLSQIPLGIGSLIGVGAGSVLSIAIGAGDNETQKKLLGNVNVMTLGTSIVYMILGVIFARTMIQWMGGYDDALKQGTTYFQITAMGAVFWIYGLAINMIVRAEGKMKSAAVMMGAGLVTNIIANYILVVRLQMGVGGAAWGTNLGMFVYTLIGLLYFSKGKASFHSSPFSFKADAKRLKTIFSLGASSLIMSVMSLVQAFVVFNALSRYGTIMDVAFYGVLYRIFTFLLTPIFGLMRALQPVIGINYGAKQYERVIYAFKSFTISAVGILLPFWFFLMINPWGILNMMLPNTLFTSENIEHFRVFMSVVPFLPVIFMAMTYFPATEKGAPAAVIGIARQLLLYVPVMLVIPRYIGIKGVYYGSAAIDILVIGFVFWAMRKDFQKYREKAMILDEVA
ncbi:MATE family efflux transporter [Fusibacter sp. 3D3]|uniref:MATE family efflux transporter n=1 Tax=Fusibacter sp. 3D3 TaxID=1048380 RepID=UPI000853C0C7|nr:MATE family efflux transporter [Fusibacter sp. 3D3]GAU75837.1 multi antimicrobial extrusion protein Na(+)/drug antiporter [Fusibacter sp. 3D3]